MRLALAILQPVDAINLTNNAEVLVLPHRIMSLRHFECDTAHFWQIVRCVYVYHCVHHFHPRNWCGEETKATLLIVSKKKNAKIHWKEYVMMSSWDLHTLAELFAVRQWKEIQTRIDAIIIGYGRAIYANKYTINMLGSIVVFEEYIVFDEWWRFSIIISFCMR